MNQYEAMRNWNEKIQFSCQIWILKVFSQERYVDVVRIIARDSACTKNDLTSKNIMDELNLTRMQFNFRISRLMVDKLVKKINNKYTSMLVSWYQIQADLRFVWNQLIGMRVESGNYSASASLSLFDANATFSISQNQILPIKIAILNLRST